MITRRRLSNNNQGIPISIHGYVVQIGRGAVFIDNLFIIDYKDQLGVDKITLNFAGGHVKYPKSPNNLVDFPPLTIDLTKKVLTDGSVRYTYKGDKTFMGDAFACEDSFINWDYIDDGIASPLQRDIESQILKKFSDTLNIKFVTNNTYEDINVDYNTYYYDEEYYDIKINNLIYMTTADVGEDDFYFTYPVISMSGIEKIPDTLIATYSSEFAMYDKTWTAEITKDPKSEYVYIVEFPQIPNYYGSETLDYVELPNNYYEDDIDNPFYYTYDLNYLPG